MVTDLMRAVAATVAVVFGSGLTTACVVQTEDLGCMPGMVAACSYSGPPGTDGVGLCRAGFAACRDDGTLAPCEGEVTPIAESCETTGDDDCDGQVNEEGVGCTCKPGEIRSCYDGPASTMDVGRCKSGVQVCRLDGKDFGSCEGAIGPAEKEDCATADDDDCNGTPIDAAAGCTCLPGTGASCYSGPAGTEGVGFCKAGVRVCNGAGTGYGPCIGDILPTMEDCATPGDDDCSGTANEGGPDTLNCTCLPGAIQICYDGDPATEGIGICKGGLQACNANGDGFEPCVGQVLPAAAEDCATAEDDDCDAMTVCTCVPGVTESCYSGPVGTMGVGSCEAGLRVCAANGMAWGPCAGEVIPEPEQCGTFADENCDGEAYCTAKHLWSARFGGVSPQHTFGVATSADGDVVLTGRVAGDIDFGGGLMTSAGGHDGFVAKFDPNGQMIWSKLFGGPGDQWGQRVAIDGQGNVIVVGQMEAATTFGGSCPGVTTPGSGFDVFVSKYDPNGNCVWAKGFGGAGEQNVQDVAVDGQGAILVVGGSAGNVQFGENPQLVNAGGFDVFVAKLDPQGVAIWSKPLGDAGDQSAIGVATNPQGDVVVTGQFAGTINFSGGTPFQSTNALYDAFVAKFDGSGAHIWSKSFGGAGTDSGYGVSVDGAGSVLVAGQFEGQVDFGGGPLNSAGGQDMFLVKLDSNQGAHLWSQRFGDAQEQVVRRVRSDPTGDVVICGDFNGTVNFGGGQMPSEGAADGFLARFNGTGIHLWSRRFGGAAGDYTNDVALDPLGNVLVAGSFQLAADFGGGVLVSLGSYDAFVAEFSP